MAGSRAEYVEAVNDLARASLELLEDGCSWEFAARRVVELRNELKVRFREGLPPVVIDELEVRNLEKYGHPVGPTAEWLLAKYGSWKAVCAAAARPAKLRPKFLQKGN